MKKETWTAFNLRNFCIRHEYYTRGDNEHYSRMLDFVSTHEPLEPYLYRVAFDIVLHSDLDYYADHCSSVDVVVEEIREEVVRRV